MLGVNLHEIPGFGRTAILTLMSEVGESIHRFSSAKAFAKWLGFTPNNKASGGKILSRKTLKNNGAARAVESAQHVSAGGELDWQHEGLESIGKFFPARGFQILSQEGDYSDGPEIGGSDLHPVEEWGIVSA